MFLIEYFFNFPSHCNIQTNQDLFNIHKYIYIPDRTVKELNRIVRLNSTIVFNIYFILFFIAIVTICGNPRVLLENFSFNNYTQLKINHLFVFFYKQR